MGRTARKTKGRFDPSERPFSKCHVSFIINDLNPTYQGQGYSSKGRNEPSPHGSFHSEITDLWGEGATEEGEN